MKRELCSCRLMRRCSFWLSLCAGLLACEAFTEPPPNDLITLPTASGGTQSSTQCGAYEGPTLSYLSPYRRTLYAWVSQEEGAWLLDRGRPLFSREDQAVTPLDVIEHELEVTRIEGGGLGGGDSETWTDEQRLLNAALGDGRSVLATWPIPFASYRAAAQSPRLLAVTLRDEAWLAVRVDDRVMVFDRDHVQVSIERVVAEPDRVAGLFTAYTSLDDQDFENGDLPAYSQSACGGYSVGIVRPRDERAYFLDNPNMVESWSIDGQDALVELHRGEASLSAYLEQMRALAEPIMPNPELPCFWANYGTGPTSRIPSCVAGYVSSLNTTAEEFRPTVRNFVNLLDNLAKIEHGTSVYVDPDE